MLQATDYLETTLQGLLKLNQLAWQPEAAYTAKACFRLLLLLLLLSTAVKACCAFA